MLPIGKVLNATLAFALELVMYGGFGVWAYSLGSSLWSRWAAAVVVVAGIITIWALFAAPTASYRLKGMGLFCLELGLMLIAATLIYRLGHLRLALSFGVLACVSQLLALVWHQQ